MKTPKLKTVEVKTEDLKSVPFERSVKEGRENPKLVKHWEEVLAHLKELYPNDDHSQYEIAKILNALKD